MEEVHDLLGENAKYATIYMHNLPLFHQSNPSSNAFENIWLFP